MLFFARSKSFANFFLVTKFCITFLSFSSQVYIFLHFEVLITVSKSGISLNSEKFRNSLLCLFNLVFFFLFSRITTWKIECGGKKNKLQVPSA